MRDHATLGVLLQCRLPAASSRLEPVDVDELPLREVQASG